MIHKKDLRRICFLNSLTIINSDPYYLHKTGLYPKFTSCELHSPIVILFSPIYQRIEK